MPNFFLWHEYDAIAFIVFIGSVAVLLFLAGGVILWLCSSNRTR